MRPIPRAEYPVRRRGCPAPRRTAGYAPQRAPARASTLRRQVSRHHVAREDDQIGPLRIEDITHLSDRLLRLRLPVGIPRSRCTSVNCAILNLPSPLNSRAGLCACAEHHKATAHISVVIFFISRLGCSVQFHAAALLHADRTAPAVAPRHRQVEGTLVSTLTEASRRPKRVV